jgi:AraC-like DNA-binding protein
MRRRSAIPNTRTLQAGFFRRMGLSQQFRALFEHLSDVHFFAKDAEGRFVAAGAGLLQRLGFSREEEILGLTDADIHPARVVQDIRADDLRVMQTRKPLIDRVEALFTRSNAKDWYLTTKLPIVDARGTVIGVMGFVRPFRRESGVSPHAAQLEPAVTHIQARHREPIAIPELARLAHLSERQLSRRFQKVFGMSAQEFVVRTRVQAASDDLLQTDKSVADIAYEHGFYDQSAFTRQFRQHTGETPLKFRQRHRQIGAAGERE